MKEKVLQGTFALLIGVAAGVGFLHLLDSPSQEEVHDTHEGFTGEYKLGTAHKHALMFVVVDGEALSFLEDDYQLAAPHVHLENNRSHIVHTHADNVTWEEFFKTIDMEVNSTEDEVCLNVKNISRCDEGEVWLDEGNLNVSEPIRQDELLIIAVGEGYEEEIDERKELELPNAYRPSPPPGSRVSYRDDGKFKSPVSV